MRTQITAAIIVTSLVFASSAETWEEKAAKRFNKPITQEQKDLMIKSLPAKPTVSPKKEHRILVISRCEGFIHTSIPYGKFLLEQMGAKTGAFKADFADGYEIFSTANLNNYDAILFNNTTNLKPTDEQCAAIIDFINNGKAIIGIHAATDNFKNWHEGVCMMGGVFDGHPWGAGGNWAFKLDDANNPVNKVFGKKGFWHTDEIYQYKPDSYQGEEKLRILVSMDMSKEINQSALLKKKKGEPEPTAEEKAKLIELAKLRKAPVSWIRTIGKGRLFYTNFGHREDTCWNPKINQHILDGIQFALGDLDADATPTHDAKDLEEALAPDAPQK